jgi:glycolate oxidase
VSLEADLAAIVGAPYVVTSPAILDAYSQDGYTLHGVPPRAVVLPGSAEEVAAVVRRLATEGIPLVVRGSGTSLSGGATPVSDGVVLHLSRMNRIVAIDPVNRTAEVEPGVANLAVSLAARPYGLFYAPDPSSQQACSIGGNIAENAGGPHCLKYGVTAQHVLAVETVLADGRRVRVGNLAQAADGLDVLGLLMASEGTLGIVTRAWLKLLPSPPATATVQAIFDDVDAASRAVSAVIEAGIIPAALEMMDRLAIAAVERGQYRVGYPEDAAAVVLVELDGDADLVADETAAVLDVLGRFPVRAVRPAADEAERTLWWANRKTAFGAMGLLAPRYYVQDGVIPRSRLPEALAVIREVEARYGLRIANVFHAGDGNLHPLILYDPSHPGEVERVVAAGHEILAACVALGGSITGEHGVGIEKREDMARQFGPAELALHWAVKQAFDPSHVLNPGKLLPPAAVGPAR